MENLINILANILVVVGLIIVVISIIRAFFKFIFTNPLVSRILACHFAAATIIGLLIVFIFVSIPTETVNFIDNTTLLIIEAFTPLSVCFTMGSEAFTPISHDDDPTYYDKNGKKRSVTDKGNSFWNLIKSFIGGWLIYALSIGLVGLISRVIAPFVLPVVILIINGRLLIRYFKG